MTLHCVWMVVKHHFMEVYRDVFCSVPLEEHAHVLVVYVALI